MAVCGGRACLEGEMLSGGSPGGPVQVTVLPLALLAQPHPRLLGLHAVGDALLVHVLRQANVGDAGYRGNNRVSDKVKKTLSLLFPSPLPASSPSRCTDGLRMVEFIDLQFLPYTE